MAAKVIQLKKEPVMICSCGCGAWRLICRPDAGTAPNRLIAFECSRCRFRIECDVRLEESKNGEPE
jgi:hypothetical protein